MSMALFIKKRRLISFSYIMFELRWSAVPIWLGAFKNAWVALSHVLAESSVALECQVIKPLQL